MILIDKFDEHGDNNWGYRDDDDNVDDNTDYDDNIAATGNDGGDGDDNDVDNDHADDDDDNRDDDDDDQFDTHRKQPLLSQTFDCRDWLTTAWCMCIPHCSSRPTTPA